MEIIGEESTYAEGWLEADFFALALNP